jgi:hypothetical protein
VEKVAWHGYLNNRIEQDHRRVKQRMRPMLGLKSFRMAAGGYQWHRAGREDQEETVSHEQAWRTRQRCRRSGKRPWLHNRNHSPSTEPDPSNLAHFRIRTRASKKTLVKYKAGEAKWSAASGMHQVELVSATPLQIVEVEIKKPGDPAKTVNTSLDPVKIDTQDYKFEFENSQVRVARVKLGAHRKVPEYEHQLNRVVVYLTDQNASMTGPEGQTTTSQHKPGDVSSGGPVKHREENLMDKTFEAIVVELKN